MRLVSLAALLLGAVPLVAAEEAEVAGGHRSCTWDQILRTLRLDQEQSIPFCRKILTTIIVVSVTVTISDTTITTQTIRPTYTNVLVKTETSTVDDQGLIKRILAERDENDDYSNSLISQYPSSALSSACSCLCVDPAALVTLVSSQTTTTQTIPETTIIDTATEFETVTGPSTTTDTTTTTTTTVVVSPTGFNELFYLRSFIFDQFGSPVKVALLQSGLQHGLGAGDPQYQNLGDQFQFNDEGHLVCLSSSFGASYAWYPGEPLNPAAPYEVPFNDATFISPPLEYLEWTGDPSTYSLVLLTEPSFDFMQLCQFRDGDFLGTWAVGTALGSDISCTELPLAIEPQVEVATTYAFRIFYQDSEGVRQYLAFDFANLPPFGQEPQQLFMTHTSSIYGGILFSISHGHLTFTLDDYYWYYAYFFPSGLFEQEGGGATLIPFNSPSFVKFNFPGDSTYFEWEIDWEAYTIYPVISGSGPLIMQICTHQDLHPTGVWAIGQILFNEDGYACTAVTLGIETVLMSDTLAPKEEFRIVYTPNGGTEQLPSLIDTFGEGLTTLQMYFTALTDEGEFPSFSFDAGGHLKFYSENPQIGYYYAWSPNYQNPVEQEWGSQINFDPAANVPDPSYYFQFDELLLLNHVNMLTVSSQQQQTIEFRVCEDSSGKAFWNAATTAYPLSGCTSVDLYIRPSTWPFRLSYLDAAGQKQYFRFSYFLFTDMSQNSIMVPTADITESALFTIDGNRHLWYGLDSQDFSGRLFSMLEYQAFDHTSPYTLIFRPYPELFNGITYLEWEIVNNVLTPVAAPSWNVPQLCLAELGISISVLAWAIGTSVSQDCIGIQLTVEWQLQNL